ncbi:MAG: peptidoglycan DD-metalloendopeptidase family protein [Acidimicrobiia bacterium]
MSWHLVARAATHLAKRKLADTVSRTPRSSHRKHVVVGLAVATAPMGLVVLTVILGVAALTVGAPSAAAGGALGIPPIVFSAYVAAEANASSIASGCAVDWPVVAGIWKVESGHATFGGRTITPAGDVTPPLYGPTLDGSRPGTAVIPDTDKGVLDGNLTWDRAVGPAQFLPGSWRAYGQDGNQDGVTDPQNVYDAALGTVAHLCLTSPGDYTNPDDLTRALRRYNNSAEYVTTVTGWITYYRAFRFTQGEVTGDGLYAFPLPHDAVTVAQIRRSHHDYPASDLGVPEDTPVYAAHPGTVTAISEPCGDIQRCRCGWGVHVAGADGHTYTYCHGTQVLVQAGAEVAAGQLIMASGNTGNSQAPHLHVQIRNPDGNLVCPQTPLEAWWNGIATSPIAAPLTGCTH